MINEQMCNSLRLLRTNERMTKLLFFIANPSFFSFTHKNGRLAQKSSKKSYFLYVFTVFFLKFKKKQICSFLLSEVSESESLRLLRTNKRLCAICSGRVEGMSDCEQIAQLTWMSKSLTFWVNGSFAKFFWQKMSDLLQNSMSEFLTLWDRQWILSRSKTKNVGNLYLSL